MKIGRNDPCPCGSGKKQELLIKNGHNERSRANKVRY